MNLLDPTATERQTIDTLELLAFLDENRKHQTLYTLVSDLPLAGVGKSKTKKEWKRIYGYEVGFVSGAKWNENKVFKGLAKVEIRVLNGWKLDALNTFGRPHSDFACLRDCVKERLVQAGYDMRNFDYGNLL